MKKLQCQSRGFTFIELLLYIAILSSVLVLVSGFLWNIALGYIKENSYQELQQNGRFAFMKITQAVKQSNKIISPVPGVSAATLSLQMDNASLNPTVFDVVGGKLRITQGTAAPIELTTDRMSLSGLKFTNLSYDKTPGIVRVEAQLDSVNKSGLNAYKASMNLVTSIALFAGKTITSP